MAFSSSPIPSADLKLATRLKIDEFERIRKDARSNHLDILTAVKDEGGDKRERVASLLEKIKKLDPAYEDDYELGNIEQYVKQAAYDQSISSAKIAKFEAGLLNRLEHHKERMALGSLYAKLLTEFIEESDRKDRNAAKFERMSMEDEFEMIEEGEIEQLRENFDSITFSPLKTDAEGIETYLSKLFIGHTSELDQLRCSFEDHGENILTERKKFTEENVTWTIRDLLKKSLVRDDTKQKLSPYIQSPAVLRELISTLNLRYSNLETWKWRDAEKGLHVEARQNADGDYCMTAEEDLLDLIFLNVIATVWSASAKDSFRDIANPPFASSKLWKRPEIASQEEINKRDYYMLAPRKKSRSDFCTTCHGPPLPPMQYGGPPPPPPGLITQRPYVPPPPPPPPMSRNPDIVIIDSGDRFDKERYHDYMGDLFMSQLPGRFRSRYGSPRFNDDKKLPEVKSRSVTQEMIMKKVTSEILIREALDGEVGVFQHDFKSFASGLPHSTILAVLKFIGVSEVWLTFFQRFLEAPLNMGPIIRGTADQVRTRKRGVPVGHAFEKFFGEAVLFFLDLAINQIGGVEHFRIRDEGWSVSTPDKNVIVDDVLQEFSKVMGLTLEDSFYLFHNGHRGDRGKISIGYLALSPTTGKWIIDESQLDSYIRLVRAELTACTSTLSWIDTWNRLVCEYADALFGPAANCFGKEHLDDLLATFQKIQAAIFTGENGTASNLTDHIKQMLRKIPGCPAISDAFIYLPQSFGGLGVQNPYTVLTLATHDAKDPTKTLQDYLKDDRKAYELAKEKFEATTEAGRARKLDAVFGDKEKIAAAFPDGDTATFLSYEEWAKRRETNPIGGPSLYDIYLELNCVPETDIEGTKNVIEEVRRVKRVQGYGGSFWSLECGERWAVQLYAEECFERYGGMCLIERQWLPLQALKLMRGEDEDDDDAGSSVSSDC